MNDFTNINKGMLFQNALFRIIEDAYPVSPGHLLIISNKIKPDFFSLSEEEKVQLVKVIDIAKELIEKEYQPDGYNIGMNCGEAAGQTIFHFHCHIIPRYRGDMQNPLGGVRHCVLGKGYY